MPIRESAISVAMAVRNGARFLPQQLETVEWQTVTPREMVICDDASTDDTPALLSAFQKRATFPVTLFQNKTQMGHIHSAFRAAAECSGEFVARCDADDWWRTDKLARCEEAIRRGPRDLMLVEHALQWVNEDLEPMRTPRRERARMRKCRERLTIDPLRSRAAVCQVHRRAVLEIAPFTERPASLRSPYEMDYDEWVHLIAVSVGSFVFIPEALVLYRRHSGAMTAGSAPRPAVPRAQAQRNSAKTIAGYAQHVADAASRGGPYRESLAAAAERLSIRSARWNRRADRTGAHMPRRLLLTARAAVAGEYGRPCRGGLGARALLGDLLK